MIYTIRHVTRYRYPQPVRESVMEVRKQPLNNEHQRCVNFHLAIEPEVPILRYQDHLGNTVHHFDVPWAHKEISVTAEAVVEVKPVVPVGDAEPEGSWDELDALTGQADYWDMLMPSRFVEPGPDLLKLVEELQAHRRLTPAGLTRELNQALHSQFVYDRSITKVDSPITLALEARRGVCQDFAHILLGLLRHIGIPARYISGYLFQEPSANELAGPETRGSHAWIEAFLPRLGWVGFDPSLGEPADHRHIAASIGRDYSDVPPTRGVYRGEAQGVLTYAVQVHPPEEPLEEDRFRLLQRD
jgi:transglutaminase-like putative cysteine protease